MEQLGLEVEVIGDDHLIRYDRKTKLPELQADQSLHEFDFNVFSDTFLTLAAIVPSLGIPVKIEGLGHTRFQETDRVAGMANELQRVGCRVIEEETSLEIYPAPVQSATIETYRHVSP